MFLCSSCESSLSTRESIVAESWLRRRPKAHSKAGTSDQMRPPNGLFFGRSSSSQSGGSQRSFPPGALNTHDAPSHAASPHVAAPPEPREQMEEIALRVRYSRVLHPSRQNGAKWFKHNTEVSTCVRKIIEGCFKGPWYSWKEVPQYYKDSWYSTFKARFEWDATIEHLVKANFDELAATRLKGMVSLAKSNGEKPDWILLDDWKLMLAYWKTPEAKAKSEKARASRLFNRDGLGAHRHRAGSRSYVKVQDVLEANNEDSSFIAVMKKTHQKPDGTYVDERARQIAEKYDEHVQERLLSQLESSNGEVLAADALTLEEKNELYVKLAGKSKQGRVFGLGSLQKEVIMSLDASSVSPPAVEEVVTLNRRVKDLEDELQKSRDETMLFQKRFEAMETIVQSLSGQNISVSTSPSASSPPA